MRVAGADQGAECVVRGSLPGGVNAPACIPLYSLAGRPVFSQKEGKRVLVSTLCAELDVAVQVDVTVLVDVPVLKALR